jgi:hypothetical protein
MNETTTALVCGKPTKLGCYISGQHGIYAPDRLEHLLTTFGLPYDRQDCPSHWRDLAENEKPECWDEFFESADCMLYMLNSFTQAGFIWDWRDGELFLMVESEVYA